MGQPPPEPLLAAARGRAASARARVLAELREMDGRGEPITYLAVARRAGVSRGYLYRHAELRAEIDRLRAARASAPGATLPARELASEASLRTRNRGLLEENRRLRVEVTALRDELAVLYGEVRELERRARPDRPPPTPA